jgi:antitoxin HigA-1
MMKNPPHPGKGLKDGIEALGLSLAGHHSEMALRLEIVVGGSADFWLRLQMNYDLAQIRNRPSPFKLGRLARPEAA